MSITSIFRCALFQKASETSKRLPSQAFPSIHSQLNTDAESVLNDKKNTGRKLFNLTQFFRKPSAQANLHESRPEIVKVQSEEQFKNAAESASRYPFFGGFNSISHNIPGGSISIEGLLLKFSAAEPGKVKVLDIGCGYGDFIQKMAEKYPDKIEPYGVTAGGFKKPENLSPSQFVEGNAENLLRIIKQPPNTFEVITSEKTMMHLTDPLGTLTQAYQLLKPGGILITDHFDMAGLEGKIPQINEYLKAKGYKVFFAENSEKSGAKFVLIQKTSEHPDLDLPIKYEKKLVAIKHVQYKKCAHYKIDSQKIHEKAINGWQTLNKDQLQLDENEDSKILQFRNEIGLTGPIMEPKTNQPSRLQEEWDELFNRE